MFLLVKLMANQYFPLTKVHIETCTSMQLFAFFACWYHAIVTCKYNAGVLLCDYEDIISELTRVLHRSVYRATKLSISIQLLVSDVYSANDMPTTQVM